VIDVLHANEEEARALTGDVDGDVATIASALLARGVGVVAVSLGVEGCLLAVGSPAVAHRSHALRRAVESWGGESVRLKALPLLGECNANGAGDAFTAGLLTALLWEGPPLSLREVALLALASARDRVDSLAEPRSAMDLLQEMRDTEILSA